MPLIIYFGTYAYSPAQGGAALHTMERPTMSYRTWKEKENAGTRILVKGMLCDVAQRWKFFMF